MLAACQIVAVHPTDERAAWLVDQTVKVPTVDKEVKIVQDDAVDPEFGTGAVKVTPAHDPNDFDMGKRHKLEPIVVMDPDGSMSKNTGDYAGMDRFEAREAILEDLKEMKLLDYKVRVLPAGQGTASSTRVLIESGDKEGRWGTVGVSENIIEASYQALLDAIEYKLHKDDHSDNVAK